MLFYEGTVQLSQSHRNWSREICNRNLEAKKIHIKNETWPFMRYQENEESKKNKIFLKLLLLLSIGLPLSFSLFSPATISPPHYCKCNYKCNFLVFKYIMDLQVYTNIENQVPYCQGRFNCFTGSPPFIQEQRCLL